MHVGIFSVADHYPDELPRSVGQLYAEILEQIEFADASGFDSFWIAEHHFHEYGAVPRPPLLLAGAAQRTKRIRLGASVVVLPFDNPLRVAEDYAMLDLLSGGRINLGVGSGYLSHEFQGFGIPAEEKRERFDEALEILIAAWRGERFSYEGKFNAIHDLKLNVRPMQRPQPPIYVAILSNAAAKFVGAKGYPIMLIPYATTERISELATTVAEFRAGFERSGMPLAAARVPFGLHTFCADSREEAIRIATPAMERYVRTRLYAKHRSIEELIEKQLVAFGTPQDVLRVARTYRDAGLTDMLAITNFGGLEHAQVLRSMELIAREVIDKI